MEVATSAVTSALRVGVQVVTTHKRPVLEIYQQVHNTFSHEHEYPEIDISGRRTDRVRKFRNHDIYVSLALVNIGGCRAENVTFAVTGAFRRHFEEDAGPMKIASIGQMPPAQAIFLMRIDSHDLQAYEFTDDGSGGSTGKPIGRTDDTMTITIDYDGPNSLVDKMLRLWRRCWGLRQYQAVYHFVPKSIPDDLPPAHYS